MQFALWRMQFEKKERVVTLFFYRRERGMWEVFSIFATHVLN